jgi:hypothetical protein
LHLGIPLGAACELNHRLELDFIHFNWIGQSPIRKVAASGSVA